MASPLRVLITNLSLTSRSGTEMYVRDLATELLRRGHEPLVYSPLAGEVADELAKSQVPVCTDLANQSRIPDVIHGHHHLELMTALLHYPGAPALFVCHDQKAWHDRAPIFPRLRRYLAVDERCRQRLLREGVAADVQILGNAVDLERFRPRAALPGQPRKALLLSHYPSMHAHLPVIEEVCRRAQLSLDVVGAVCGRTCPRPEEILPNYDIVFAKARCALEAMACGCAVVLCDAWGAGPMVRGDDWPRLRPLNFGRQACVQPLAVGPLLAQVARYDPADAETVCGLTRRHAGLGSLVDALELHYREVMAEQAAAPPGDAAAEARAAAAYLRRNLSYSDVNRFAGLDAECASWKASAEQAHKGWAELQREYDGVYQALRELRAGRASWQASAEQAHRGWAELQREYDMVSQALRETREALGELARQQQIRPSRRESIGKAATRMARWLALAQRSLRRFIGQ